VDASERILPESPNPRQELGMSPFPPFVVIAGKRVGIESKFVVGKWSASPRNPGSTIGNMPFAVAEQATMIEQAKKSSAAFDVVIYHSNSPELIAHYTREFQKAGITNFQFILIPTE
jgi:hypothetical protein